MRRQKDLAVVESALGTGLPADLRSLLSESDGIRGHHGLGLVWSSERILSDNVAFRTNAGFARLYMPFHPLLFFADAGNGDQFALLAEIDRDDVFIWDHETDSRSWVAGNLATYFDWWLTGRLKV